MSGWGMLALAVGLLIAGLALGYIFLYAIIAGVVGIARDAAEQTGKKNPSEEG